MTSKSKPRRVKRSFIFDEGTLHTLRVHCVTRGYIAQEIVEDLVKDYVRKNCKRTRKPGTDAPKQQRRNNPTQ